MPWSFGDIWVGVPRQGAGVLMEEIAKAINRIQQEANISTPAAPDPTEFYYTEDVTTGPKKTFPTVADFATGRYEHRIVQKFWADALAALRGAAIYFYKTDPTIAEDFTHWTADELQAAASVGRTWNADYPELLFLDNWYILKGMIERLRYKSEVVGAPVGSSHVDSYAASRVINACDEENAGNPPEPLTLSFADAFGGAAFSYFSALGNLSILFSAESETLPGDPNMFDAAGIPRIDCEGEIIDARAGILGCAYGGDLVSSFDMPSVNGDLLRITYFADADVLEFASESDVSFSGTIDSTSVAWSASTGAATLFVDTSPVKSVKSVNIIIQSVSGPSSATQLGIADGFYDGETPYSVAGSISSVVIKDILDYVLS